MFAALTEVGSDREQNSYCSWRGKHLFNPTNFGIVALILATDGGVWVSPGQWGNVAFFGFLMACLGGLVVNRAARADVTVAWLACYLALLFGRSYWLDEPMTIPVHRLESGGLLLFSFFMISDPKTTPDSRLGRMIFAALVAYGAWWVQFRLFRTNSLLWSLAAFALLVPVLDYLFPGKHYSWRDPRPASPSRSEGGAARHFPCGRTHDGSRPPMKIPLACLLSFGLACSGAQAACTASLRREGGCKLFNKASQVVLVRDEDKTVLTMASDYRW